MGSNTARVVRRARVRVGWATILAATALTVSPVFAGPAADPDVAPAPPRSGERLMPFAVVDTQGGLSLHDDMYMLPGTWSDEYKNKESEVIFQLSAKLRLKETPFFVAYTQVAFWQLFNGPESRPFRETNYNPQVFYRITSSDDAITRWIVDLGIDHQSNGRSEPESRSWNRLYATAHYQRSRHLLSLRLWHRLEEDVCPLGPDGLEEEFCRDDSGYDDNPRITDFMGYGEVHYRHRWIRGKRPKDIHFVARGNLATGKGGVGLDYSHAAGSKDLHWFVKAWHGYGESLADHDRSITRFGLGVLFRRTFRD